MQLPLALPVVPTLRLHHQQEKFSLHCAHQDLDALPNKFCVPLLIALMNPQVPLSPKLAANPGLASPLPISTVSAAPVSFNPASTLRLKNQSSSSAVVIYQFQFRINIF